MRHYEVVVMIHPDQYERVELMADRYKKIVTDSGGAIHRFENWGRRNLAYIIQNQKRAYYLLMNIECGKQALSNLEESFRFSGTVIRSLVIRREIAISEDSPIRRQAIASAETYIQTDESEADDTTEKADPDKQHKKHDKVKQEDTASEEVTAKPETPADKPEEMTAKPETPADKPEEMTAKPETPADKPEEMTAKPETPADKPEEMTAKPETPADKPS